MESQPQPKQPTFCEVCGSKAEASCGGCHQIYYCSKDHQKQDWKLHKLGCLPYAVVQDNDCELQFGSKSGAECESSSDYCKRGKHLIASRDLAAGSIILEESPAFFSPLWDVHTATASFSMNFDQLCITCGKLITHEHQYMDKNGVMSNATLELSIGPDGPGTLSSYSCSRCTWPVCSVDCANLKMHAENECKLFQKHCVTFPPRKLLNSDKKAMPLMMSHLLAMVRGVGLKYQDPKLFRELQLLFHEQDNQSAEKEDDEIAMDFGKLAMYQLKCWTNDKLNNRLHYDQMPLKDEKDYETINSVCQLHKLIASKVMYMWKGCDRKSAMYMFTKSSQIKHSCRPNCTWSIGPSPHFKIRVRTSVSLKKGDRLTINRLLFSGTALRSTPERNELLKRFSIDCKCERCMDPSELGLFSSAIACPACKNRGLVSPANNSGYLLPIQPLLVSQGKSDWECNNNHPKCKFTMEGREYTQRIKAIDDKFASMRKHLKCNQVVVGSNAFMNYHEMADRAVKYGDSLGLHPNHSLIHFCIKTSISIPYFTQHPEVTFEDILRKKQMFTYSLEMETKMNPGLSFDRIRLIMQFISFLNPVLVDPKWMRRLSRDEIRVWYDLFKQFGAEALKFYKNEFSVPGDSKTDIDIIKGGMRHLDAMNLPWFQF